MPDSKPTAAEKTSWMSAALIASVFAVILVFVVLHFGQSDAKPLPIVDGPAKPPPPSMDLTMPPATSAARNPGASPATSAAPLSAIPAETMVEVFVISTPVGASVTLEGRPVGFSPGPITISTALPKVTLDLTAPGYEPAKLEVTPTPGKTFKVALKKATRRAIIPLPP